MGINASGASKTNQSVNTSNRTFGNGNRTTVNRTTNVNRWSSKSHQAGLNGRVVTEVGKANVTNVNVNSNNNRTVNTRSFENPSSSSTRTVAQAKSNSNTRSFGVRQAPTSNNSNASKGTFGRR